MPNEKQYKVTDSNGVIGFNGRKYEAGEIITNEPAAHVNAWLRFGQVEPVTQESKPGKKSKGGATAGAAAEPDPASEKGED